MYFYFFYHPKEFTVQNVSRFFNSVHFFFYTLFIRYKKKTLDPPFEKFPRTPLQSRIFHTPCGDGNRDRIITVYYLK